jgi:hypothetical protein
MPEGSQQAPDDEPERPASYPTEPLGTGSRPTEPLPPPGSPEQPPPAAPPPPGAYGQYGYPAPPQTEPTATAALLVAIIGFFVCFPLAGLVALLLALNAERKIKESGGRLTGLDQVRIAKAVALVELALVVLGVILFALLISLATHSGSAVGSTLPAVVR